MLTSSARIVTITAPAGYGKSRFARSLAAAIGGFTVADAAAMFDIPAAARELLRAAGTRALWLENAELLASRPDVATLVDHALRTSRHRIVICSRVPLALDSLARIAPNERYAIGTADLIFSPDEIAALFAPLGVEGASLARVVRLSHGWPIAVLMFARAVREGRLIAALDALDAGFGIDDIGDYTLHQGLGSLSERARETLAAAAILGWVTDGDLELITDNVARIAAELDACPFVSRSGRTRAVHPLAVAALAPMRSLGEAVLVRAAERADDAIDAARLFTAGGQPDRAADVLDHIVPPFMMGEPTRETVSIAFSLDADVLMRHPATWNATLIDRASTATPLQMLDESRVVWSSLPDDAPIALRIGVGLAFVHWLTYLGDTDESEALLARLAQALADHPPEHMLTQLVASYQQLTNIRRGVATIWPSMVAAWDATFGDIPMVAAIGQYTLKGPYAFLTGERDEARRAFALGVEIGASAQLEIVHVTAITNARFFAWLAGEGGEPLGASPDFEFPVYRAYRRLIVAGCATYLDDALVALRDAVDDANGDGSPWLRALVWIAVGLADPAQREVAFARALAIARPIAYPAFRAAVADCTQLRIPDMWAGLRAFVRDADVSGGYSVAVERA